MKTPVRGLILAVMVAFATAGCGKRNAVGLDPDLARFVAAERIVARTLADAQTNEVPVEVWRLFDTIERDDWRKATNLFSRLERKAQSPYGRPPATGLRSIWESVLEAAGHRKPPADSALTTALWAPITETFGTYEVFHEWDGKWLHRFAHDIIDSIPTNSIYFGGTDAGRFAISAFSPSHREGKPFFTVTQNQLADARYLDYLRTTYGPKFHTPTADDSQRAFQEYIADAQRRLQAGRLNPGENVRVTDNRVQVSGQVAVMQINGLLARTIIEKNPDCEIYLEESIPLYSTYPQLAPHGLILKFHRNPLTELSEEVVRQDRDYWNRYVKELIGDWLTVETTVAEVCEFAERVHLRKDLAGFKGDTVFVQDTEARQAFSKLRNAIAGLYAWRSDQAGSTAEKERMLREADLAFRQALALCPSSPETARRYVELLLRHGRKSDARRVAETFRQLVPADENGRSLTESVEKAK